MYPVAWFGTAPPAFKSVNIYTPEEIELGNQRHPKEIAYSWPGRVAHGELSTRVYLNKYTYQMVNGQALYTVIVRANAPDEYARAPRVKAEMSFMITWDCH